MAIFKIIAIVAVLAVATQAMPRYVAIPIEDMERLGLVARPMAYRRVARMADSESAVAETVDGRENVAAPSNYEEERPKRQSEYAGEHGNSHVDYGAYTGGYGAFGWYTDHPVGYGL